MEKDDNTPETPIDDQGANIIPFRRRLPEDLVKAILRHPASGTQSIEETLRRLNIDQHADNQPLDE